jgi:hypothetical protein
LLLKKPRRLFGVRGAFLGRDCPILPRPHRLGVRDVFQRFTAVDTPRVDSGIYDFKNSWYEAGRRTASRKSLCATVLAGHKDNLDDQIEYDAAVSALRLSRAAAVYEALDAMH